MQCYMYDVGGHVQPTYIVTTRSNHATTAGKLLNLASYMGGGLKVRLSRLKGWSVWSVRWLVGLLETPLPWHATISKERRMELAKIGLALVLHTSKI